MSQQPFDLSSVPRDSRRVPIATKVAFKFDRFAGFISEYSANISPTGMFITTNEPEPPGSVLDFEFQLGDGFDLIRGKGEVVWIRAIAEGPGRPAGIGIRFLELAEGSKELIYRIVDQYIQDGGTPFDVSLRPPDPVQPIPVAPAHPPAEGASPFPELPDSGHFPKVDSSSWLPPEPAPIDDDFPPFMPPLPPMDEPEPPRPTVHFGGFAASVAPPRRSPVIPLAIVGLVLVLAAAGYYFRDMFGFGGAANAAETESVAPQGPPPPGRKAAAPPPQETPESITPIVEEEGEATPMPEVVRRREDETPAPAAPAAPEAASAPSGPTVTAVERITFEPAAGGTDIILWGNGAIRPEVYDQSHIANPPRELIRLTGITRAYPGTKVAVGTGEVKQIRVGYHEKAGGNELHVVIDLADPGVQVTRIEAKEKQLRIHLQKR